MKVYFNVERSQIVEISEKKILGQLLVNFCKRWWASMLIGLRNVKKEEDNAHLEYKYPKYR